jgi:NADH:ubiquinone oxidoreductase subunit E
MEKQICKILAQFSPDRSNLLAILQKVKEEEYQISPESIKEIGHFLNISENDIYGVITFYKQTRSWLK